MMGGSLWRSLCMSILPNTVILSWPLLHTCHALMLANQNGLAIFRWRYANPWFCLWVSLSPYPLTLSASCHRFCRRFSCCFLPSIPALYPCLSSTLYEGIVFIAESIFSWKVEAKASRTNTSCDWCMLSWTCHCTLSKFIMLQFLLTLT